MNSSSIKLKYKIKFILDELCEKDRVALRKELLEASGMKDSNFSHLINAKASSNKRMSLEQALGISEVLECHPKELINN
ncbi:MAG: helix-turn-helix domain-containing protein [Bacteroidota bacterium]